MNYFPTNDGRNATPNRTTIGHAHMLAKDDAILYMHVCNIRIIFLFEVWNFWVSQARETIDQI